MERRGAKIFTSALAALAVLLLAQPYAVGAAPSVAHVALGEGRVGHYCVPGMPGPYLCFSTLSIDASDRPEAFGHAVYAGQTASIPFSTNIAFTCVVIKDITDGHTLYASGTGTGTNPGTYFVNLTVSGTSSYYGVSRGSTGGHCGAGGLHTNWALGKFQITPVG